MLAELAPLLPELTVLTNPISWTRKELVLQPTLTVVDKDDLLLANATVSFGDGFAADTDSLVATKVGTTSSNYICIVYLCVPVCVIEGGGASSTRG